MRCSSAALGDLKPSSWAICDVSPTEEAQLYVIEEYAGDVFAALQCNPSTGVLTLNNWIPRQPAPHTHTWTIDFNNSEPHDETALVIGAAITAAVYAVISYGMHTNMKRTFMMTVRRLAGTS